VKKVKKKSIAKKYFLKIFSPKSLAKKFGVFDSKQS
jgi:hypothetical protein